MRSKHQGSRKKALRELANIGEKREMEQALSELQAKFEAWRSGALSCFDLNDAIHAYHDHTSRDIWKRYRFCPNTSGRGLAGR